MYLISDSGHLSSIFYSFSRKCTLDMLALHYIIEEDVSSSIFSFICKVKCIFIAVSVVFVTPLAGIVSWSSLLSAEGFESATLVFPSPPIYPDPS